MYGMHLSKQHMMDSLRISLCQLSHGYFFMLFRTPILKTTEFNEICQQSKKVTHSPSHSHSPFHKKR